MGCVELRDPDGRYVGHLCRPTMAHYTIHLRKAGHRNWEVDKRRFKTVERAIYALHKRFVDGGYKRGSVAGMPPRWSYQEPVWVYEIKRERPIL